MRRCCAKETSIRATGWTTQVFYSEIRKLLAYRFDFWMQFVFSVFAHLGTSYFLWRAVFDYRNVKQMQGYSFLGLMFYYLALPSMSRMIYGPGLGAIAREIYDGSLTRYLAYPVSFFGFKYVQYVANAAVFLIQFMGTIGLFALLFGIPPDIGLSGQNVAMGIGAVMVAGMLAFWLSAIFELIAFWADNVWSLLVMMRFSVSLLGGGMLPLAFFPEHIGELLYLLPFSTLAAFPIESFLGKITPGEWMMRMAVACAWVIATALVAKAVWRHGMYRYTGVGI